MKKDINIPDFQILLLSNNAKKTADIPTKITISTSVFFSLIS